MAAISLDMYLALFPEIGLTVLALFILTVAMFKNERIRPHLGWITAVAITIIGVCSLLWAQPGSEPKLYWGEMIRLDSPGFLFRMLILAGAGLTALFAVSDDMIRPRPEFYLMLVSSAIGLSFMASSGSLIMLFLAVETASIPLYVMAGLKIKEEKSVESGIKYFLFGAMSSAILLYGFSLLYGYAGTTRIYSIGQAVNVGQIPLAALIVAAVLILGGFAFKISAAPFHFWAPDVYEGAATPIAGYLSTVSKAAGFAALMRVLVNVFGIANSNVWMILVAVMAAASMFIGNLLAIPQKNIKRMIAYSSIAQAGYILVGVASGTSFGLSGAVYYLMGYLVTNLAVFAIIGWVGKSTGSDDIQAFSGLNRKAPGLTLLMMIALLSLGGIPPFVGFFGKLLVFGSAIEGGLAWLAIIGVVNSVIGLYYYLRVLKAMYLDEPVSNEPLQKLPFAWTFALAVCIIGIVILGILYSPWFNFTTSAGSGF